MADTSRLVSHLKKKAGYPSKRYKYPGKRPTPAQLAQRVGPREEDGSFRTSGRGTYDPDTGTIRRNRRR